MAYGANVNYDVAGDSLHRQQSSNSKKSKFLQKVSENEGVYFKTKQRNLKEREAAAIKI
jgi:hypothetical protein